MRNEADRPFKHPYEVMAEKQKEEKEKEKSAKGKKSILDQLKDKISHLKKRLLRKAE